MSQTWLELASDARRGASRLVTEEHFRSCAADHARLMTQTERELRQQGDDNVLLVPALED